MGPLSPLLYRTCRNLLNANQLHLSTLCKCQLFGNYDARLEVVR